MIAPDIKNIFANFKTMSDIITVRPPRNLMPEDEYLFRELEYHIPQLAVKKRRNIFVTYSGFCLDSKGLIRESHHDYPNQYDDYLAEAAFYYKTATDDPENLIVLDNDDTYLLIHHPWYNYYHWLCECIFRLLLVKNDLSKMTLLLPDYYGQTDFIMGSLEPFTFKDILFIPKNKSLYIKNLCLPQIKPIVDSFDYGQLMEIRELYLQFVLQIKKININLGEKIYISREKASRKKVHNEEEIIPILKKYGFVIVNNEDYTFQEQVSIYSNVKCLASIHGSGLTSMLFMKKDSSIFEMHKRPTNDRDWHGMVFWYLADSLGYNYYHQVCEPTNPDDDYFHGNIIVDPVKLEENLKLL